MIQYSFNTAYTQAKELYGVELDPNEFESIGLIAWDRIGNKNVRLYRYMVEPVKNSDGQYQIDLPCNCDIIEAVTASYEDYQKTSPINIAGNTQSGWIEGYTESRKFNTPFLYSSGKYVKYEQVGQSIYLADKFDKIFILYKGVVVDDTGLPFLNTKEVDAIAAFCAYTYDFRRARLTKDGSTFQMAQFMENKWKTLCSAARVPEYITQNEMDEILNVQTSWDRKRFGKSFKPIK